jgi:CRP-like cAMP-binding protein
MVAAVRPEGGGVVTFASSGYPVQKPMPGGGPTRAQSVKLAIKLRMEVLAGVPLFAGLSNRQLQEIARGCTSRRWPSNCVVVPEDTKAEVCYIIVEGTVDVRRHSRTIARLGPGEFFGEIALLDPGPRSATVTTTTEMTSLELSRQSFLRVAGDKPAILLRMLEALAKRLRETTEKLSY